MIPQTLRNQLQANGLSNMRILIAWILAGLSPVCFSVVLAETGKVEKAGVIDEWTVDFGIVLNETRHHPTGINLDYLMDDDRNPLLCPRQTLADALRELGPRYLRYPGGWKSAVNLWSVPPYSTSRPTLAGPIPEDWIRAGLPLTRPDGNWRIDPLDFDEFMELCRALGAEPYVIVAYESCHWRPNGDWTPPTREQLIETAVAWVHYANKAKGHAVKYWEIGNETWLNNEVWMNKIAPQTYTADLVEFSKRMKAEDPSIQIGANGDTDTWWKTVLPLAAEHIDFLSVHSYPCWKWTDYEQYRTSPLDISGIVKTATHALDQYASVHKNQIKVMLTEFAAGAFGPWDNAPSDLGRALITFDLQGQLLQNRQVFFSQFWNTHNIYSEIDGGVFDALKRDNTFSPIGRALWIWNHYLGDEMVATTSTEWVRCFAGRKTGGPCTVFLLNKDTSEHEGVVILQNLPKEYTRGKYRTLQGNGPSDRNPTWERADSIRVENSRISVSLDPVSITVIVIQPWEQQGKSKP